MVVTGPNDAGVVAPVEVRRGTATDRTGRSWQCNRIDLNQNRDTKTTVVIGTNDAGVAVPVEIRRETEAKAVTDASGFKGTTTTATATSQPERATLIPGGGTRAGVVEAGTVTTTVDGYQWVPCSMSKSRPRQRLLTTAKSP